MQNKKAVSYFERFIDPDFGIDESQLKFHVAQNFVKSVNIRETIHGEFYVTFQFNSDGRCDEWFLATYRKRNAPKIFKDLSRLNTHLQKECPNIKTFYVHRYDEYSGKDLC